MKKNISQPQSRFNLNLAGHHGSDTFHESVDLEVGDRPVDADRLGSDFLLKPSQVIADVVLEYIVLELGAPWCRS